MPPEQFSEAGVPFIALFYRNFLRHQPGMSHVGLGVNALHTAKVLRKAGVRADVFPVWDAADIAAVLHGRREITHAVVEAPWVAPGPLEHYLLRPFPNIQFVCRNHSNIGFLQVEAGAINLLRWYAYLEEQSLNFRLAANSLRFCHLSERAYKARCLYLPNLYDLDRAGRKTFARDHAHRSLRVGSFGSLRLLKNHTSAAAAALLIADGRGCDLEFWVSVGRQEHGKGVIDALRNMFRGLRWARLIENPWEDWAAFRRTVAHMDLCLQPSMTETFNLVIADACAEGVPAVVSEAIDWVPPHWVAKMDDVEDMARVGNSLLSDRHAAATGLEALARYMAGALPVWTGWLAGQPRHEGGGFC